MAPLVEKAAGPHLKDLWWHWPTGLVDRRTTATVQEAVPGTLVSLKITVVKHEKPGHARLPYRILCQDDTGFMTLSFFRGEEAYLRAAYPEGETRWINGRIEVYGGVKQMLHPERVAKPGEEATLLTLEPVYPLTAGLTPKRLRQWIIEALARTPFLPEWISQDLLQREGWPDFKTSLAAVHNPQSDADLAPDAPARMRLAYDELLAHQLALFAARQRAKKTPARPIGLDSALRTELQAALPWALTRAQEAALDEIAADLRSGKKMMRLLQGDVGSGKTVVAFAAMAAAVRDGAQAAMMAPTEILARQHFASLSPLCAAMGIKIEILTGRDKGAARREKQAALAAGDIGILVGTHALFQDDVAFKDLALAVIDEQHRFGVHQRLLLSRKGDAAHTLITTATPIPRTLAMTIYGDMDVSALREKPAGRKPIATVLVNDERIDEVVERLRHKLDAGEKAFWVCPLVAESEMLDMAAATERQADLVKRLGRKVGLLHGQMKPAEKDQAMADFISGATNILVSTTVIEVGVDVPEATVMVIEQAERFGLAQLHQLRGRVGRGDKAASCILLYRAPLSATAEARLKVMRETNDGFLIAEEDLRLRGPGEMLGTLQSGAPLYRLAQGEHISKLMSVARKDAQMIAEAMDKQKPERLEALRCLLYLFERDAAIDYFRSA